MDDLEEYTIRGTEPPFGSLTFRGVRWINPLNLEYLDPSDGPDVAIHLEVAGLSVTTTMPAYIIDGEEIATLFREIDRDWRGWVGEKKVGDEEQWLALGATHDGTGRVRLAITIADGSPTERHWTATGHLTIDVGSAKAHATGLSHWTSKVFAGAEQSPLRPRDIR